jgi:endo-1,4-beta-xylanase
MLSAFSLLMALSTGCLATTAESSILGSGLATVEEGLRTYARKRKLLIGTEVPLRNLQTEVDGGRFASTVVSNFDFVELENEFKPPAVWLGPREYDFAAGDFIVGGPGKKGWAQKHKVRVRGHVLLYASDNGYTLPAWIKGPEGDVSKEEASALLHDYIFAFAGRYRGKIAMWDVVNEAIDDRPGNGNPFNLRNSYWFRKLGPEFLVLAFKWAHEADPKAELYYNDYSVENGGEKGKQMLALGKWLKEQGAPITGMGLQYHIDCTTKIEPGDGHYNFIEEIRKLGLAYMITELDVAVPVESKPAGNPDFGLIPKDSKDLDRQAEVYASVFKMALASRNCHGVQVWGFTDRYSWIPGFSRGKNGAALLFDRDYAPKPAYRSVEAALKGD